jgi:hypothetical protein
MDDVDGLGPAVAVQERFRASPAIRTALESSPPELTLVGVERREPE